MLWGWPRLKLVQENVMGSKGDVFLLINQLILWVPIDIQNIRLDHIRITPQAIEKTNKKADFNFPNIRQMFPAVLRE